jgi:hypothetical protein
MPTQRGGYVGIQMGKKLRATVIWADCCKGRLKGDVEETARGLLFM